MEALNGPVLYAFSDLYFSSPVELPHMIHYPPNTVDLQQTAGFALCLQS